MTKILLTIAVVGAVAIGLVGIVAVSARSGGDPTGTSFVGDLAEHLLGGGGGHHGGGQCRLLGMAAGAVAETLSINEQELQTEMQAGKSVSDVAQAHGMTTSDFAAALTKIASDRISGAVVAGTLTQARADQLNQQLSGGMDFVLNFKLDPGQSLPCSGSGGGGFGGVEDGDASPSPSPSNTLTTTT
jgi:hypothetical protein